MSSKSCPLPLSFHILEMWGDLSASAVADSEFLYFRPGAQHDLGIGTEFLWGLMEVHHPKLCLDHTRSRKTLQSTVPID